MVTLNRYFTFVLLAVAYVSGVSALASSTETKRGTGVRLTARDLQIEPFHPPSTFEAFETGIDHPLQGDAGTDLKGSAISFVSHRLSVDPSTVNFRVESTTDTLTHAFLTQQHDGIPFANAVANVAFDKDNKVVSFGSSFVKPTSIASSKPDIAVEQAISAAEKTLGGKFNDHPPTLEFLVKKDNSVVLTHVIQVANDQTGAWFEAFVDAHSGEVVSLTDFVAEAAYRVLPIWREYPTQAFPLLDDSPDTAASPDGWHKIGTTTTTDTSGNNCVAYKGAQSSTTRQSAAGLVFDYNPNFSQAPTAQINIDAARVNAFYVSNMMHDFTYRYGFTETKFNFQQNNFGNGAAQADNVLISVQDASGFNNAFFATPPDGQNGRMTMLLWNYTNPNRDGSLENDIMVHEYTHGVTNRMTGGGTGRCLQTLESSGLGEGWSDAMADWVVKASADVPDFLMGGYVTNRASGFRSYPYSTSAATNPLKYADVGKFNEAHSIGEVWANILHNLYAALVGARGWSANARTDPSGTQGNVVWLHLFLDALLIQPCNPTMIQARGAWFQADTYRYSGMNNCLLWGVFASRGLGVNAKPYINDFTMPGGCTGITSASL